MTEIHRFMYTQGLFPSEFLWYDSQEKSEGFDQD